MANYLLLRNNKESGPHSVSDLVKLGLKAYDLVWIEGKSAAWRYPSEIEELKPYAPVAEEQPFDRFFKKSTDTANVNEANNVVPGPLAGDEFEKYAPPVSRNEKITPRSSVYVTMPGQKVAASQTITNTNVTPSEKKQEKPRSVAAPAPPPVTDDVPEIETKYSQPLDEIKEMYVKTLRDRKTRIARKSFLLANFKRVAVIAGFVLAGLTAGYFLKSVPVVNPGVSQAANLPADLANKMVVPAENERSDQTGAIDKATAIADRNKIDLKVNFDKGLNEEQPSKPIRIRKETMIKPAERKEFDEKYPPQSVEVNPQTGERTRSVRNVASMDAIEKPLLKTKASTLADLVTVSTNDYKRVAFGGIRNLQLTVTNNSGHTIDNVIVELVYLRPSEEPLRTENIRFPAIAPNESSTVKIPDTNRGIKITYKLISVSGKPDIDDVAGR
jgi:hypothetical protein